MVVQPVGTSSPLRERRQPRARPPGLRVVMDVRALRSLPVRRDRRLSDGCGASTPTVAGRSFAFLLASDEDDPTKRFTRLEVIGRRLLPPIRLLRSAALTVDPFLLRGASVGAAWRAELGGAAGAVYHTAGGGLPIGAGLPTVATLLDLAPWELPRAFQRTAASRFGSGCAPPAGDAAAVLVGTGRSPAARRSPIAARSIRVVPLAAGPAYAVGPTVLAGRRERARAIADALGLGDRYLVYPGRHDVRQDAATMLTALAALGRAERPHDVDETAPWPPRVLVLDATPDDRASLARVAVRHDAGDHLVYAPALPAKDAAAVVAARAASCCDMSESSDCGARCDRRRRAVLASAVGALPSSSGPLGSSSSRAIRATRGGARRGRGVTTP